jgi:AcrR family transcriptional regulator
VSEAEKPEPQEPARLPRGPHGLPRGLIAQNQRERLIAAMVRVCAAKGYNEVSVADVLEASGVGRESFYELFEDKQACFLAAHSLLVESLFKAVRKAYETPDPWPQRVRAALSAALDWLAADPDVARVTVVEVASIGPVFAERFQESFHVITEMLDEGRELSETARELPRISSIAAGAIFSRLYEEIFLGRAAELPSLLPTLTFELLMPFVGVEGAREEELRAKAA